MSQPPPNMILNLKVELDGEEWYPLVKMLLGWIEPTESRIMLVWGVCEYQSHRRMVSDAHERLCLSCLTMDNYKINITLSNILDIVGRRDIGL